MGPRKHVARKLKQEPIDDGGHLKRRMADAQAARLNDDMRAARLRGHSDYQRWLIQGGYPTWTARFVVKRARTRTHYRVWASE